MKKKFSYLLIALIVLFVLFALLKLLGVIGISQADLEKDAIKSSPALENLEFSKSICGNVASLLFFNEDESKGNYRIYVKQAGLHFGYFFRAGGTINLEDNSLIEYKISSFEEKIFISLNQGQVSKIEIIEKGKSKIVDVDRAFTYVINPNYSEIKFYDDNNNEIFPIKKSL